MHKEIFKNTTFQIMSRVITTGIGFVITILIARHFGAYQFGEFSKITAYVAMFYLFVDFGLNAVFLKDSRSFSSLFYLRMLLSVFVIAAANLAAFFLPYNQILDTGFSWVVRIGIFIFSFTIFSQSIIFSTSGVFQKNMKFNLFMYTQAIGEILNLFIIVILIFFSKSLYLVILSFVISNFVTAILSTLFIKENFKEFNIAYSKKLVMNSLPIGIMLILNLIYFRIDVILLSVFKSNQDVAFYSLAYRFFDFFIAIPLFLSNSLYPKLLENIRNREKFAKLTTNYIFIYLIISLILIIPIWFLSPLFGLISQDFSQASVPFKILIISLPAFFLTSFVQWVLISLNEQKFLMYVYFIGAFINIILNLVLIPKFSYIASAWITVGCELFILLAISAKLKLKFSKS